MRIDALHLLAYGPFTDTSLTFGADSNLHLIYGPNEAGKSSALRALDALLFGIPARTNDNFVHRYQALRLGGEITNRSGQELAFQRRKRQRKSLAELQDDESPLPENALFGFLHGCERETFLRLHCIDHEELRAGGERMRQMNGLLGESLFAASMGGSALVRVLEGFEQAAKELHGVRSGCIRQGIAVYQEAKKRRSAHEVTGKRFAMLREQYEGVRARKDEVVAQQTRLETKRRRLIRLRDALPKIEEWKQLEETLAGSEPRILPPSYSSEERSRCEASQSEIIKQMERTRDKLQHMQAALAQDDPTLSLLDHAEAVEALQHRVGLQFQLQEEVASARQQREVTERVLLDLLHDLGSDVDIAHAGALRVRREHRSAIEELATREGTLRSTIRELIRQREDCQTELDELESQLQQRPPAPSVLPLRQALAEVRATLAADPLGNQQEGEIETLTQRIAKQLARLPDWEGDVATLVRAQVPGEQTIEDFHARFQEQKRELQTLESEQQQLQEELADNEAQLNTYLAAGDVPSETELEKSRAARDADWDNLVTHHVDLDPLERTRRLQALHTQTQQCDELADRLRREADRVAAVAVRQARAHQLAQQLTKLQGKHAELRTEAAETERAWQSLCEPLALRRPLAPRELLDWRRAQRQICQEEEGLQKLQEARRATRQRKQQCADALRAALRDIGVEGISAELTELTLQAQDALDALLEQTAQAAEQTGQRDRLRRERNRLDRQQALEEEALAAWQDQWREAMAWIGATERATAAQALARLRSLDELQSNHERWQRDGERIVAAQAEQERFARDVDTLLARVDGLPEGQLPLDVVPLLVKRIEEAKTRAQERRYQTANAQDLGKELTALEQKHQELGAELAHYLHLAGVDDPEELLHVEIMSRHAQRKRTLEEELTQLRGTTDLASFVSEAESIDVAELDAQVGELDKQLAEEDARRDRIVAELTEVKTAMDAVDGNDTAAQADQCALNHLTQVYEDAEEFITVRLAGSLLRRQIEKFREDNRDPILARASQLFAEMTGHTFRGLVADYDEGGVPILVGERGDGSRLRLEGMSDGTLDPLYLSLRLAYLLGRLDESEPMPFIVDDILIHLDDERALATLRVLAEVSRDMQVLFFTHHARLKELAQQHLADRTTIHELVRYERLSA